MYNVVLAGEGPFPGVIDMFGGVGGLYDARAALLASRGFAAFSLAYFAYDDLPASMDLNLEYFMVTLCVLVYPIQKMFLCIAENYQGNIPSKLTSVKIP